MGNLENRKNWKFSYKLQRGGSKGRDLGKWWVVLLFLSIILSCERDTKNRNDYAPVLSESKKDSLFLSDFYYWNTYYWYFNDKMKDSLKLKYIDNYKKKNSEYSIRQNNTFFNCFYSKNDSIVYGNSSIWLIYGYDFNLKPSYFFKTKVDSFVTYRNILIGNSNIEDTSLIYGEVRLTELEYFINSNYLIQKNPTLEDHFDKLILLYSAQSKSINNRTSYDYYSFMNFENIVKYDTSILNKENIDDKTIIDFFINSFPIRTGNSIYIECIKKDKNYSDIDKDLILRENRDIDKKKEQAYLYLLKGYKECLKNFRHIYNKHYSNNKKVVIYFSKPEMKFYFIRIEKEGIRSKIYFRTINGDKYPTLMFETVFGIPSY